MAMLLAMVQASEQPDWHASSGPAVVTVDTATFAYSLTVGGMQWLSDGQVAVTCGGERFVSSSSVVAGTSGVAHPLVGGKVSTIDGVDPALGKFSSVQRTWTAGECGALTTEIRHYNAPPFGIEFVTRVSEAGMNGTATEPKLTVTSNHPATEFPNFAIPDETATLVPSLISWEGNSLRGMSRVFTEPSSWSQWSGGLEGGPIVLHRQIGSANTSVAAMFGPSSQFKTAILSHIGARLLAGVQGMITALPPSYDLRFALVGSADGVTAVAFKYGAVIRQAHGTINSKLSLSEDVLSRKLHYVNDGGSLLNYCDYWPQCVNPSKKQFPDGPSGCTPMAFTLKKVSQYHRHLGLNVGLYHVDPFWYSQEPFGGCSEGPYAKIFTASPYSFPEGLRSLGIQMMLFLQGFDPHSVYATRYRFAGQSVAASDAARFFHDRFTEIITSPSQCSALTIDGLAGVYYSHPSRYTSVDGQSMYDSGLANAALKHNLSIRIDQQSPSDVLASVQYGARTVARCTADANPCPGKNATGPWAPRPGPCYRDTRWTELAGAALFLRSVGLRPFTDVIWTTPIQSTDPRWGIGAQRPTVVHDLIVATLTTGPVGFGDLVNCTDAKLLNRSLRQDGVILRPASAALRVNRFYDSPPTGGAEIWVAVTGPAGSSDPRRDGRANSMAALGESEVDAVVGAVWWWSILATNVDGTMPNGSPLKISELWPQPEPSVKYLVAVLEYTCMGDGCNISPGDSGSGRHCYNGSLASSCLALWDTTHDLPVGTTGAMSQTKKNFTLLAASPLLDGWALLGDLTKLIPCSPQRFVAPSQYGAPRPDDLLHSSEFSFTVLGTSQEVVDVTIVTPPSTSTFASPLEGIIYEFSVEIGSLGSSDVRCIRGGGCRI